MIPKLDFKLLFSRKNRLLKHYYVASKGILLFHITKEVCSYEIFYSIKNFNFIIWLFVFHKIHNDSNTKLGFIHNVRKKIISRDIICNWIRYLEFCNKIKSKIQPILPVWVAFNNRADC